MNNKNNWRALSMSERAFLIREAVRNGITDIGSIRDTWEHRFDGLRDVVEKVNTSDKDFARRLRQEGRASIPDWEDPRGIATHKLSVATDENGIHFIYPDVQNIDNRLVDYSDPSNPHYNRGPQIAAERGDTIQIGNTSRDLRNAIKFTEKYKKLGIYPEFSAPPHKFDGEEDTQQKTYISKKPKNNIKTGNVEFDLRDVDTWRYHQAPTYSKDTDFTLAFTDALLEGEKNFKWGDKYYSTEVDYNKKFTSKGGQKPFEEFANSMYPAVIQVLQENNMPIDMAHNIVRQAAMESDYGLSPRGEHGFNLSGIKWTQKAGDAGYDYTMEDDGEKYINFKDLKEYITYKVRTLNNNYNALEASNVYDYVEALHPEAFKKSPRSKNYKGDYSQGAKNYKKSMTGMSSLDKTLMRELYFPLFGK